MTNGDSQSHLLFPQSATPSFRGTIFLYIFSNLLFLVFGFLVQRSDLLSGLIISELVFIAAPALIYTLWHRYDLSRTFCITSIRVKTVLLIMVTTGAAFVLAAVIAALQGMIFPHSQEYQKAWEMVLQEFHQIPFMVTFLVMAVLPGVCEELLFRGFLLQGMRKKYSDTIAIVIVGFLFGVIHLDPYRFFPISLLGIVFGYIVVKTGSIFSGIVAHSTNNAIIVLLSYIMLSAQSDGVQFSAPQSEGIPVMSSLTAVISAIVITGIALTIFLLGLRALPRAPIIVQPPENIEPPPLPPGFSSYRSSDN